MTRSRMELILVFILFISECVKHFQGYKEIQVKRGKDVTQTTTDNECSRRIKIYISNAKTRLKRKSTPHAANGNA